MAKLPIPLRKVPLIAKWSPKNLANLLINVFEDGSYLLTAYEWIEGHAPRAVCPSTMQEALAGLDTAPDTLSKIAMFPACFFVWLDELEIAYQTFHHYVSPRDELDIHGAFDMNPATHQYNDLLLECPNFSSNPYLMGGAQLSKRELSKQKTQERNAKWQARADELHRNKPNMTESWIANHIAKEPIAEGKQSGTIRRIISISLDVK